MNIIRIRDILNFFLSWFPDSWRNEESRQSYLPRNLLEIVIGVVVFIIMIGVFIQKNLWPKMVEELKNLWRKMGKELIEHSADSAQESDTSPDTTENEREHTGNNDTDPVSSERTSNPVKKVQAVIQDVARQEKLPASQQNKMVTEVTCLVASVASEDQKNENQRGVLLDDETVTALRNKIEEIEKNMTSDRIWLMQIFLKYVTKILKFMSFQQNEAKQFNQMQNALWNKYGDLIASNGFRIDNLDEKQKTLACSIKLLIKQNELNRKELEFCRRLETYPKHWIFFKELHFSLQSFIFSIKVLNSGKVARENTGKEEILKK
jgi:hypothetical protein